MADPAFPVHEGSWHLTDTCHKTVRNTTVKTAYNVHSHTHTHTHTHTISLSLTHTLTHTHSLSLSHTHTHTRTHACTHTLSHTHKHSDTHTYKEQTKQHSKRSSLPSWKPPRPWEGYTKHLYLLCLPARNEATTGLHQRNWT